MATVSGPGGLTWVTGQVAVCQGVVAAGGANGDNYTPGAGIANNGLDCHGTFFQILRRKTSQT